VTYQAKHPAAFINVIAEDGTKAEAVEWLQRTWDENFALQARIDALMLEYCPDEMTQPQRARWAASQRRAGLETRTDECDCELVCCGPDTTDKQCRAENGTL
jgi:hypothetical protein